MMTLFARKRRLLVIFAAAIIIYLMLAYIVLPFLWTHHEREPGLASLPMVTRTSAGIPGDALNVGLVGSKEDVLRAILQTKSPSTSAHIETTLVTLRPDLKR